MPKVEMDYSKTIIYKICCKDINITDIYVGHTTNFTKRKNQHKSDCNNPNSKIYNYYVYQFIRNNGNWNNWDMIEIEKYNCNDKLEACKRERHWFEELKASLNKQIPSRTKKEFGIEYYIANKKDKLEKANNYYSDNKEKIKAQKAERIQCLICNCEIRRGDKAQHQKSQKHQDNLNNQI